jgi:hypothetical protein
LLAVMFMRVAGSQLLVEAQPIESPNGMAVRGVVLGRSLGHKVHKELPATQALLEIQVLLVQLV